MNYGFLNTQRGAKIFDIGQGTGILGKLLSQKGFTNLDAADASPQYVRIASESGWYNSVSEFWFGRGVENLPDEMVMQYDVVMGTGIFMDGHIPGAGMDDAHALLKTGGHFVTCMRRCYYENGEEHGYKDKLDELIAAGKFEIMKTWEFMRGIKDAQDPIFAEMPTFMFVARRLD